MVLSVSVASAAGEAAFGLAVVVGGVAAVFALAAAVVVVDLAAVVAVFGLAVVVPDVAAVFGLAVVVVGVVVVGVTWPNSEPVKHKNKNPRICSDYHSSGCALAN